MGEGEFEEELEEGGQRVCTCSYKISKYHRCNVQHNEYS